MRLSKIVAGLLVGVGLLASQQPASAKGESSIDRYLSQMAREGWVPVQTGVFQRTTANGGVEYFTHGEEGLRFSLQQAINRFGDFIRAYDANPTSEAAEAAEAQADEVNRLRAILGTFKPAEAKQKLESFLSNGCTFSFSYNAVATYLTTSQGVSATASSSFSNSCGYTGNVYSYAYVEGRLGSTFTTSYQRNPVSGYTSGANVSTSASRTLAASSQCLSTAEAAVTIPAIGVNLSATSSNTVCPVPLPTVNITGSTYLYLSGYNCSYVTWTATGSGGTPGYSFAWTFEGYPAGTGSTMSQYLCGTNMYSTDYYSVGVTLTDSASQTATDSKTITVQSEEEYNNCNQNPWQYPYLELCPYY